MAISTQTPTLRRLDGSRFRSASVLLGAFVLVSCGLGSTGPGQAAVSFAFDFRSGAQGWQGGVADYYLSEEADLQLDLGFRALPAEVTPSGSALFANSKNAHGLPGTFTYYSRRVSGLDASRKYDVSFDLEIATDTPSGCGGIEAPPGEGVFLKAGASTDPLTSGVEAGPNGGIQRVSLKKGEGSSDGTEALVLGNMANGDPCNVVIPGVGLSRTWRLKSMARSGVSITTDASGNATLLFGTDAGALVVTRVYFTRFSATFTPR